jgi:hypothetical protein
LFKVKGEFREGHIGFSGESPFFSCIAIATEEKLAEANEFKMLLAAFQFNFKQLHS